MNLDPTLPVGRRIKLLRERRGLSRAVVAGLCGRSESWLKKIEQGTRQACVCRRCFDLRKFSGSTTSLS